MLIQSQKIQLAHTASFKPLASILKNGCAGTG